jgi:hypothetical protein
VEITYYTAETLALELREYEEQYGMPSDAFLEIYRSSELPPEIHGPDGFRWADTIGELCRLQAVAEPQPA